MYVSNFYLGLQHSSSDMEKNKYNSYVEGDWHKW